MAGSGALQFKSKQITANHGFTPAAVGFPYSMEDFLGLGATLADNGTVLISQAGTPTTAAAVTAGAGGAAGQHTHGGWLAGSVDNVDAEIDEIALGLKPWLVPAAVGVGLIWGEVGFVVPTALTARQYFFGMTDDETEGTATNGSLNIDGTTNVVAVAADAAGFIMSSLATDADGWYTGNAIATVAVADATNTGLTAVVDRYTKLRVEIDSSGNAYYHGAVASTTTLGRRTTHALVGSKASAVTASVALLPLFAAAATTTTAVEWEIDYIAGGATIA
jgi:hypothetical protein